MKQSISSVVARGVELTEDLPPVMAGSIFGDAMQELPTRGDGSVPAAAFNNHLEDIWLQAMAACGETIEPLKLEKAA
jgi:hypothetical protein